jgi:hypothetical protein
VLEFACTIEAFPVLFNTIKGHPKLKTAQRKELQGAFVSAGTPTTTTNEDQSKWLHGIFK